MEIEENQRILTIKQFVSRYPWPSESALRAIIQKSSETGFDSAFMRYRRRVLINVGEFFSCLERHQKKQNEGNKPG